MTHPLQNERLSDLMSAFNFTLEDLAANQLGYMTRAQRNKTGRKILEVFGPLPKSALKIVALYLIITPLALPCWAVENAFKHPETITKEIYSPPVFVALGVATFVLVIVIVLAMLTTIFLGRAFFRWWRMRGDFSTNVVLMVNGYIQLNIDEREVLRGIKYDHHTLHINGYSFEISERQWAALVGSDQGHVRLYYLPSSKLILSGEPISR